MNSKSVVSNPFSLATNQPKIPDGAAYASFGAKRQMVQTFDFGEQSTVDIIISPRFDTPIYIATAERADGSANPAQQQALPFADNHPFQNCWKEGANTTSIQQDTRAEISKIRLVSQGTRITLTNSTDDNDGWFEAFRFTPAKDHYVYKAVGGLGTPGGNYQMSTSVAADMFGNRTATDTTEFTINLAAKSNYVTGKLRNLHRYTWVNKPSTREVHFKTLPNVSGVGTIAAATAYNEQFASIAFQDWDYDVIWLRVHGRGIPQDQAGGCCMPTKLLLHTCQNVECIFGEQNLLHPFMTRSPMLKAAPKKKAAKKAAPKKKTAKKTYKKK